MSNQKIGVVILTKNNNNVIETCLDSFINNNTYKDLKFYIGDTGSTPDNLKRLREYLKSFPFPKELLQFKKWHFAKNHNYIIFNRVKEDLILACNDDIELINDPIHKMVTHMKPTVATVGAKLLFENNKIQHGGHFYFFHKPEGVQNGYRFVTHRFLMDDNKELQNDEVPGNTFAFVLINKKIYKELKGIPEYYKVCFEDVEYCVNAVLKGYKHIFCGEAECYHYESTSRKKLSTGTFDADDGNRLIDVLNNYKFEHGMAKLKVLQKYAKSN